MEFFSNVSDVDSDVELDPDRDVLQRTSQSLGLTRNYVTGWTARDAFREFFQNWMDGIISTQRISRENITIAITDSSNEWIATAHRPGSQQVLGFIRHTKVGKAQGMLELTNFKAQLSRKSLELGVSSKRHENNTAGTHGEGYKVAALVMVRKGYQVRYESSKFYWTFQFGGRQKSTLYCKLTPMADGKISKYMVDDAKLKAHGQPRKLTGNIWEDVTVKIGRVYSPLGKEVDFDVFKDWVKIAFALDQPLDIIRTKYGDLILDKEYSGRMYLKGLFLGDSLTFKKLKFGYNLADGRINRDRQRLATNGEEATNLASIWAEAISKEPGRTVKEYVKMLKDDEGQWADVSQAKEKISKETAGAIWKHLHEVGANLEAFYCDKKFADEQSRYVRKYLKKRPEILPSRIWEPLKKYGLVRTPQEYAHHFLHNAAISEVEHTAYSDGVRRALSAVLALDERTKHLTMVFKSGSNAELDLFLEGNNLLINDKWLDFEKSHENAPCWLSQSLGQKGVKVMQFPCDHIVTGLYHLILQEIQKLLLSANETVESAAQSLRMRVGDSLQQMPRLVAITQGNEPGELIVNWTVLERDMVWKLYGVDLECRVMLHRESTCSAKKTDLLFTDGGPENVEWASSMDGSCADTKGIAECGCPYQISSQQDSEVIFKELDAEEKYFPMVARDYDQAFFGVPPEASHPAAPDSNAASPASSDSGAHAESAGNTENETENPSEAEDDVPSARNSDNKRAEKSSGPISDNDASQDSQVSENETTLSTQEQQTKAKSQLRNSASEQLQPKEQLPSSTAHKLQIKEQELATALEALENKQLELRQVKAEKDAQKQSFESTIEDLQSEVQQLQETQSENETRCAELSSTIENLRGEVEKLREEKTKMESQTRQPVEVEMTGAGQNSQGAAERVEDGGSLVEQTSNENRAAAAESVSKMLEQMGELKRQINQARADQASITTTLQGVSGMIQGVMSLGTRATMITTLQGVLGMIQGVLSLGVRMPTQLAGTKHPRIKEEDSDEDGLANAPKRLRQAEHIDLTE